ncbi:MAG: thioredoxin family protein [Bacteroidota bacterium]
MNRNRTLLILTIAGIVLTSANGWTQSVNRKPQAKSSGATVNTAVTFIELGSVNCIPCRQMQPVMKAVGEKYGKQVNVVFHDVWKPDQRKYAEQYGIRVIPTQVFLDQNGKEFFRHEGFFPEAEIDKLLQKRGLTVRNEG